MSEQKRFILLKIVPEYTSSFFGSTKNDGEEIYEHRTDKGRIVHYSPNEDDDSYTDVVLEKLGELGELETVRVSNDIADLDDVFIGS